jgi:hypothetical protein
MTMCSLVGYSYDNVHSGRVMVKTKGIQVG